MRPISNIVDITNYVMLELGQPLHAFDYHRLRPRPGENRPAIIVRRARPGEQMTTLDGSLRTFDGEMLLITDGGGPVAVAGVMGGLESEITDATTDILLESANFHFLSVRRTSRLLGLTSEAAQRFGRQVDPELTVPAALRAALLMAELAGGTVAPSIGDLYPGRQPPRTVELNPADVTRILGVDIPPQDIVRILTALEFTVQPTDAGHYAVTVPSHRPDVARPVDLVEEIGRVWGYDRFPPTLLRDELPPQRPNVRLECAERVRDLLVGCGLDEVITYSLVDIADEGKLCPQGPAPDPARYLRLRNPLSADRAYLRQTLLPSLLRTLRENLRFQERVAIFEIGAVYLPVEGQQRTGEMPLAPPLPDEPLRLGVVMTGPREPRSWLPDRQTTPLGFYDLKGVVEALLAGLGLSGTFERPARSEPRSEAEWRAGSEPRSEAEWRAERLIHAFHPGRCAQVLVDGHVLGVMGELHPLVREAFDLPEGPVAALEFDLEVLLGLWGAPRRMTSLSLHPPVYEDLAVVVDEETPAVRVRDLIAQTGAPLVRSVVLFDVYRGEQIGAGRKSLAYRLTYQADDRTLTDAEVARVREKIVRRLEREIGATLRGAG